MPTEQSIIQKAYALGAMRAAGVSPRDIATYPSLRELCEMNHCGCYGSNWGCPPGCGSVEALTKRLRAYSHGVVYQYTGTLTDSFDFDGMMAANTFFNQITYGLKAYLRGKAVPFLVLGAGKCSLCEACTYPDAPCRNPLFKNISVEACGINVSELCTLASLPYVAGKDTVTNTGLVLF
ncbi:MAG: DUF2284 domain-containing protein [Christensenella sp.]|nr:DUF2284 domain-containing protein [Christensenella sp.]